MIPKVDKLPQGVICNFVGVKGDQNHNVLPYYEPSLRDIKSNKT